MDEPIAGPDARVTALAEKEGLGGWRMAAANVKGGFRKRWGDDRLHLYENGLVVTAADGGEWVRRWDSTAAVLQHLVTINGGAYRDATYTLIGRDGAALSVGRGGNGLFRRDLDRLGATSHTRGPYIVLEGQWGPEIQQGVTAVQWPLALERLRRGETLDFGPMSLDLAGVREGKYSASWAEIGDLHRYDGKIGFLGTDGRALRPQASVYRMPNAYLFMALVNQLKA
ncbi:DUF6585 family protein [Streptomyces sp. NBC_01465]|uniref:DUF6585 family protein n=1 Tax=Streptomyces sp. NBC_01465 TaxID=2903878 RepID=UPI002E34279F|nr:DUF6585 family protein [Streptomyces sp. NBC_01465]